MGLELSSSQLEVDHSTTRGATLVPELGNFLVTIYNKLISMFCTTDGAASINFFRATLRRCWDLNPHQ